MVVPTRTVFVSQNPAFFSDSLSGEQRSDFQKGSAGHGLPCSGDQVWPGEASALLLHEMLRAFRPGQSGRVGWVCRYQEVASWVHALETSHLVEGTL